MKNPEKYSSSFFILFSILILSQSLRLPLGSISQPESGFFPSLIAFLLLALSFLLFCSSLVNKIVNPIEFRSSFSGVAMTVATVVLYAFFLDSLGYLVCTLLAGVMLMKAVQQQSWRMAFFFSILYSAITYFGFKILGVFLPRGFVYFL